MIVVDETVLLRYLLDDSPRLSKRARDIVATGQAFAYREIIARTVVTLRDVYGIPRSVISSAVVALLDDIAVYEPDVVRLATRLFGSTRFDYTDCLLLARNTLYGDEIASFNRSLVMAAH